MPRGATPLPTAQVAVLIGVRLAEPIAYTVIFPFINQMIEELGITDNPDRVGFYSGLVESVFAFVQFFTVYQWAKLSDRIGRKPVIVFGLSGVAISISLFGLSRSYAVMLLFRCIAGGLNGNVAVIKASLGDLTDETNSTEAFALYGMTWTLGSIFGNALGGALSHPAQRFGWTGAVWSAYPFLLPCLTAGVCTLTGLAFAIIVYKETLSSLVDARRVLPLRLRLFPPKQGVGHLRSASLVSDASVETLVGSPTSPKIGSGFASSPTESPGDYDFDPDRELLLSHSQATAPKWGFRTLLRHRPVQVSSLTLFINQFVSSAWSAVALLFWYDRNHGMGMSAAAIGGALAINGMVTVVSQLLLLTRLQRALGLVPAYRLLTGGWVLSWIILPRLRDVLEWAESPVPGGDGGYGPVRGWPVTLAVNALLCFTAIVQLNFSLLMVIVNNAAPDRSALGAVNGISSSVGCLAKMLGPSIVSALFAVSVDRQLLGGRLWWLFMVAASVCNFGASLLVTEDSSTHRRVVFDDDDDDDDE